MIFGARVVGSLLLAASLSAPFQCSSKVRPEHRLEEEPAEALYQLAERFGAQGNVAARAETLRFVVERYPASRFAEAAKVDLQQIAPAPPR